jgi:hypothetical protein
MTMSRRLQLLLDEDRYARVARAAREQRVSVATVIRDAIDASLPPGGRRQRAAARVIREAEPMEVPDVDGLLVELDELRGGRR